MVSSKIVKPKFVEPKKLDWHSLPREKVLQILQTRNSGLTDSEVREKRSVFGYNEIVEEKQKSAFTIFAKQFKNVLIVILLGAILISALNEPT